MLRCMVRRAAGVWHRNSTCTYVSSLATPLAPGWVSTRQLPGSPSLSCTPAHGASCSSLSHRSQHGHALPLAPAPGTSEVLQSLGCTRAHAVPVEQEGSSAGQPTGSGDQDDTLEATCVRVTLSSIPGDQAEQLSDALLGAGAQSVVVVEHREEGVPEQEIFEEPGSGTANLWDTCDLVVHFPLEADVASAVSDAAESTGLELSSQQLQVEGVANEQWVDQIKASYVPLQLSRRMHIVPEWCEPPSDPNALSIVLQPGVAFGTGEHPTTRMCLELLETHEGALKGSHVMDYGAGSGILALAALKLGAATAVATDTDPLAVRSAQRNGELNGVEPGQLTVLQVGPSLDDPEPCQQSGHPRSAFEVVCANILRGPLIELQPRLSGYVKPGGLLILSGILQEQVPDVMAAYGGHFDVAEVKTDGQWAAVAAVRS